MLQLEPTNLLEPLDLRKDFSPFARPSDNTARPPKPPRSYQTVRYRFRRIVKTTLIIAGGLACVGVGMALPQLPNLVVSDSNRSSAIEPPRNAITADTLAKPSQTPDVTPPEVKPVEPATDGSGRRAADTPPPASKPASASVQNPPVQNPATAAQPQPAPAANESANAPPCNPKARHDDSNCLAGGPTVPLTGPAGAAPAVKPTDPKPAATASASPPPPSAKTAAPQPVNTQSAVTEQAPAATPQDRKQERTRSSSRRRDRGNWDDSRSASYWGAPDDEGERGYGGRRDRYGDEDRYRGDRRSARRGGWREEERVVVERGPHIGGPPGLFGLLPFGGD
jgi:hypothetical protein